MHSEWASESEERPFADEPAEPDEEPDWNEITRLLAEDAA